jgi:hypothetical protein
MDHDIGPFFAPTEAQVRFNLYVQRSGSYFLSQLVHDFFGPAKLAVNVLAHEAELFHWNEPLLTLTVPSARLQYDRDGQRQQSQQFLTLTYLVFPRKFTPIKASSSKGHRDLKMRRNPNQKTQS